MADIALYRKYRPQEFAEVIGQEHVTGVLETAITTGNIAHAYLFSGTRGTGKTSIARIVARRIGCTEKDLYEIDAASNRGIDDVRALRESVHTLPFESPYKVYLIDEVHMLTREAFNALLKTLEEPPAHVVFILATTEPHKLPDTIISRCETHHFKQPSRAVLCDMVQNIAKREKVKIAPEAVELIALVGNGSFRDTHGVLQKVLHAQKGGLVTFASVAHIVGAPTGVLVERAIDALAKKDTEEGLEVVAEAIEMNLDMELFLQVMLERLRAILLLRNAPRLALRVRQSLGDDAFAYVQSKIATQTLNSHVLLLLLSASEQMRGTSIKYLPIELAIIANATPKEG